MNYMYGLASHLVKLTINERQVFICYEGIASWMSIQQSLSRRFTGSSFRKSIQQGTVYIL